MAKMRLILFAVFMTTFEISKPTNPRSVNVALETSLLFEPGEENNFSFFEQIRRFIDQIEKAITPVKAVLRTTERDKIFFTTFLEKVGVAILKYDDSDLKDVAKTFVDEVENLFDTNEIFDENTQASILNIFIDISKMKTTEIRLKLKSALNNSDTILSKLFVNFNNYFNESDKFKFENIISKFNNLHETRNFEKTVQDFLSVLKNKHTNLTKTDRDSMDKEIRKILEHVHINKRLNNKKQLRPKTDDKEFKNLKIRVDNTDNENNTAAYRFSPDKNEIVINKDVEVFIRSVNAVEDIRDDKNYTISRETDVNKIDSRSEESSDD